MEVGARRPRASAVGSGQPCRAGIRRADCTSPTPNGVQDLRYEFSYQAGSAPKRTLYRGRDSQRYFMLPAGEPVDGYRGRPRSGPGSLLDLVPKAMRCGNRVSRKSRSRLCVGMRLTWSGPGPAPALWCREESAVRVDRRSKPAVRANATSVTMCQRAPRAHDSNVRPGCASLADAPRGARWPCVCGRNRQGRGGPRGFRDQTGCVLRTALSSDAVPASRPLVLSTLAARTFGECPRPRGPEQRGGSGRGGRA